MASGKLVESWTFQRTLPEPFKDYTDDAVFKNIASKYCTQPQKNYRKQQMISITEMPMPVSM